VGGPRARTQSSGETPESWREFKRSLGTFVMVPLFAPCVCVCVVPTLLLRCVANSMRLVWAHINLGERKSEKTTMKYNGMRRESVPARARERERERV